MSDDLLSGIKNGTELDAATFSYEDALSDLCDLVDGGFCTPNCLFGQEDGPCQCRCGSIYHGRARDFHGSSGRDFDAEAEWLRTMPGYCEHHRHPVDPLIPEMARMVNARGDSHITKDWPAVSVRALYRCDECRRSWHTLWDLGYHFGQQWWRAARQWA